MRPSMPSAHWMFQVINFTGTLQHLATSADPRAHKALHKLTLE
jgi:hypothetical protein